MLSTSLTLPSNCITGSFFRSSSVTLSSNFLVIAGRFVGVFFIVYRVEHGMYGNKDIEHFLSPEFFKIHKRLPDSVVHHLFVPALIADYEVLQVLVNICEALSNAACIQSVSGVTYINYDRKRIIVTYPCKQGIMYTCPVKLAYRLFISIFKNRFKQRQQ